MYLVVLPSVPCIFTEYCNEVCDYIESRSLKLPAEITQIFCMRNSVNVKGRFLEFQRYNNFANLFSKLSESTFYKK